MSQENELRAKIDALEFSESFEILRTLTIKLVNELERSQEDEKTIKIMKNKVKDLDIILESARSINDKELFNKKKGEILGAGIV